MTSYGVSMTTLEEVFLQLEDTGEETSESTDEAEPTYNQVGCPSKMNSFLSSSKGPLIVEFWNVLFQEICIYPSHEKFLFEPPPHPSGNTVKPPCGTTSHKRPYLLNDHFSKIPILFFFTVKSLWLKPLVSDLFS